MVGLKIGVLTFHRCVNYGSYWQARCLVEGLRARGHNAVVLDHHSSRINLREWKCALKPVLPTAVPKSDYPLYRKKIRSFLRAIDLLPTSRRIHLDNPSEMDNYDLVIVGSDEVWNLFHPWYGGYAIFFGNEIKTRHLSSYAASFGNYPASLGLEQSWTEKLRKFDFISVRDENSKILVTKALGIEPEIVLDPCLQFPSEPEKQDEEMPLQAVAVYGHNFSDSFAHEVRRWAHSKNLTLVSIGYRNDWADQQWITADPDDFASFVARSVAVATNFFHGCVFALRNEKPFACEASPYRRNKLQSLMDSIGAEKHLVAENTQSSIFDMCLGEPLNPDVLMNIKRLREISSSYLDRVLDVKGKCA
jgi:polysaccharide pyruvyl transferase WcaK-like protein